jgi:hypothetical protein
MARFIFGPTQPIIQEIRRAAANFPTGRMRVAVALARDDGVCWLLDALGARVPNRRVIVGINERGTTV